MKKVFVLPSFERSAKKLIPTDKKKLAESLEAFNRSASSD